MQRERELNKEVGGDRVYTLFLYTDLYVIHVSGYSCKLLNQGMDLIVINEDSLDVSLQKCLLLLCFCFYYFLYFFLGFDIYLLFTI